MNTSVFFKGLKVGIPIGLGYFAVSFSLGINASAANISPFQGFIASFFNLASAGEKALFDSMKLRAAILELIPLILIINARYMLMSFSLSQKLDEKMGLLHRLLIGFGLTDEIFGAAISYEEEKLNPWYNYGIFTMAIPLWSIGTALGIKFGQILPPNVVRALAVSLYGMFIAIIIPPCKKNMVLSFAVLLSFAGSYLFSVLPVVRKISGGTKTIILTVLIAGLFALIKPVEEKSQE